jgi:cytochrome P450
MFTFTGSGTDLLIRALALISSNPGVHHKVVSEVRAAGPLDRAETIEGLPYLQACLLEAGRLFPPVTKTFHAHASGGKDDTVVHWFPLLHRDERLGQTVNAFRPERWLGNALDAAAGESNLFLRGPRACPGMHLILFVCKAALARIIVEQRVAANLDRLASDPLPVSFPKRPPRFTVLEESP